MIVKLLKCFNPRTALGKIPATLLAIKLFKTPQST